MPSTSSTSENVSERFLKYIKKRPFSVGTLANPSGKARLTGQCGDSLGVHVAVEEHIVKKVLVQPEGCVYTEVCAAAMTDLAQGLSINEILKLESQDIANELGGLPEDHMHCASLALNTLGEALTDYYSHLISQQQKSQGAKDANI